MCEKDDSRVVEGERDLLFIQGIDQQMKALDQRLENLNHARGVRPELMDTPFDI